MLGTMKATWARMGYHMWRPQAVSHEQLFEISEKIMVLLITRNAIFAHQAYESLAQGKTVALASQQFVQIQVILSYDIYFCTDDLSTIYIYTIVPREILDLTYGIVMGHEEGCRVQFGLAISMLYPTSASKSKRELYKINNGRTLHNHIFICVLGYQGSWIINAHAVWIMFSRAQHDCVRLPMTE
ncbi:uncharacterized protein MYCFIDRAFT_178627 [Pseudocercospora fijiensis CIRAD86]|uniref:Uncharacterized protein n=1 Tax=Pseudocercospora fijiensis (strain CIRAD86) TaxID=383855 RepID=M2ZH70_PSEFD|nr:uncharacterized protein MYCFIDRAFT_178627 [Pseudocercospora fijiensis CIRAD86]EME78484.1 hypothetical protein MYCFIDRAFT_178627 [Pseudocercospora fijiensis CIRAD86]